MMYDEWRARQRRRRLNRAGRLLVAGILIFIALVAIAALIPTKYVTG